MGARYGAHITRFLHLFAEANVVAKRTGKGTGSRATSNTLAREARNNRTGARTDNRAIKLGRLDVLRATGKTGQAERECQNDFLGHASTDQ